MEAEGFTVYEAEWWHFDYKDWQQYPILNERFDRIRALSSKQSGPPQFTMSQSDASSMDQSKPRPDAPDPFLLRNVRIFDGIRVIAANSVLVSDGKIMKIGRNLSASASTTVIDGTGDTLLPVSGSTFGASLHGELRLLVQAGVPPTQALAAATSLPARMFRLSDRGIIAIGMRADLLLVAGDPTRDVLATRNIVAIWKRGVRIQRHNSRRLAENRSFNTVKGTR